MASPEELFARFRQHTDADALAAVFDALAPSLLLVAAHVAPAGAEAEDLVQATFLGAMEDADRWDASRPLMPWLIGILINRARNDRRQSGRKLDAARLSQPAERSPLDALAASEVAEQIAAALASLPRQLRQTLSLRLVHGLTPTEIAHTLGCPVATAKTRLQRGMEWLRKVLPAGIAVSVAGAATASRGLAAVRAVVLGKAKVAAAGAGVATAVIAGGLAMKKVVIATIAVLCMMALWVLAPRPADPARGDAAAVTLPGMQVDADSLSPTSPIANEPPAHERVAMPGTAAAGTAELQFVWKGEGRPATEIGILWNRGLDFTGSTAAITDAQGRLHFAGLAAGEYQLWSALVQHRFTIRAGEETRERIEVEPFARFDGLVVDGEGRGVAGATVCVDPFDDLRRGLRLVAVTDEHGHFRGCADTGGWVWASKPGLVASEPLSARKGENQQLRLVLAAAGTGLRGTVLAADGSPAADALVAIVQRTGHVTAPIVLRGDARGRFASDELAAGEHLLVARAPGHAVAPTMFTIDAGIAQQLEIQLQRGATVLGTVHAAHLSSPPSVVVRPDWVKVQSQLAAWCNDWALADGEGNYRLEHVPTGRVMLEARAISDSARQLQLSEGEERRCDFTAPGGGEIHGRIVDAEYKPVAGWWVHAWSQQTGYGKSSSPTDAEGRFHIDDLAGSSYRVTAMPITASSDETWLDLSDVRPGPEELLLRARHTLQDGGFFTGTALDSAGAPATTAGGSYRAVGLAGSWSSKQATLHEDGSFELGPLPPGSYQLVMNIAGSGSVSLGTRELLPRARVDLGIVRVPASGAMELRFARADGTAVMPIDLSAWDDDANNGCNQFERGADGIFRNQQRLPAGTYRVVAWGEDFARTRQEAVVVAGRATLTDVVVTPARQVHFELPKPAGLGGERWVAQVQLRIKDSADQPAGWSWLPIDGTNTIVWTRGFKQGSYTYEAALQPNGAAVRGAFTVSEAAEAQSVEIRMPAKSN